MSSTPFNKDTPAEEAARILSSEIAGKNVLIVGATVNSLGAEFLRAIAPYAKTIWVAGRSTERLQAAVDEALKSVSEEHKPNLTINILQIDLTSFASIRAAAAKINAAEQKLDVILHNIQIASHQKLTRTEEGFEAQIGGNHFGTFLLTSLLLPRLKQAGPGARVVTVSSQVIKFSPVDPFRWDDVNFKLRPEEYSFDKAYTLSKQANALFTKELAKRAASEGILAFTLHPGMIMTNGVKSLPLEYMVAVGAWTADGAPNPVFPWKTLSQGTSTHVVAAFDPSIKDRSGAWLEDGQILDGVLPEYINEENAAKLWELSEELVGIKFF